MEYATKKEVTNKIFFVFVLLCVFGLCEHNNKVHASVASSPLVNNTDIDTLTVISVPSEHISDRRAEDIFLEELLKKGFKVTIRSDLDKVLQELEFQRSGITEAAAIKIGRILNADAVVILGVSEALMGRSRNGAYLKEAVVSARLISVEEAKLLWVSSHKFRSNLFSQLLNNPRDLFFPGNRFVPLFRKLAKEFPYNKNNRHTKQRKNNLFEAAGLSTERIRNKLKKNKTNNTNPFSGMAVYEKNKNVIIFDIKPNTLGSKAGLRKGDIIRFVNGEEIKSLGDWRVITEKIRNAKMNNVIISFERWNAVYNATL